jgi:hypothetical protein
VGKDVKERCLVALCNCIHEINLRIQVKSIENISMSVVASDVKLYKIDSY